MRGGLAGEQGGEVAEPVRRLAHAVRRTATLLGGGAADVGQHGEGEVEVVQGGLGEGQTGAAVRLLGVGEQGGVEAVDGVVHDVGDGGHGGVGWEGGLVSRRMTPGRLAAFRPVSRGRTGRRP